MRRDVACDGRARACDSMRHGMHDGTCNSIRGQVTLFFAVGLVMLIMLAIIYLALSRNDDPGTVDAVRSLSQNAVVQQYLTSCLDTIMNDELQKLGSSGGLPQSAAPGAYPSAIVGSGDSARRVLFGITRNRDCTAPTSTSCTAFPVAHPAPKYPDDGVTLARSTENRNTAGLDFLPFLDGYFGDVNFPGVCSPVGSNALNGPNPCRYYAASSPRTVSNPPGTPGPSTQQELLGRVNTRVSSCADIGVFSRATGAQVTAVGTPSVNITFVQEGVLALFEYSVTVQGSAESQVLPVSRRYDVRYLAIAQYAYDLAREETRNVTFNITDPAHYGKLSSYREGFSVGKARNAAISDASPSDVGTPKTDIVSIIDARSRIDDTQYSFSFLVEHRPPMLDVLSDASKCDTSAPGFDPQAIAADPDETPLAVAYDGATATCTVTDASGEKDWQVFSP
ncbi:TPA: hypothetical protein HA251_08500 [Candidatus Woesearchaeota archaeon]|nr:hypothetical protein [Candidatus Woesearchaeota archaeon]